MCRQPFDRNPYTGLTCLTARRTDELPRSKITPEEWPKFLQATTHEWEAILSTPAVTFISPKAAEVIRRDHPDRIIPSRYVYRNKPGEGFGSEPSAKCRWCVLGFRDPDLLELQRAAPTPPTINNFLLVAASLQREVSLGDLKSAFMQSDTSHGSRPKGKIYASD